MDTSSYNTILFIDSMVALEAKPIPDLPWAEIDPAGPILVLIVPQVNKEVDKRKRDGRIGKKSRDFNRLIEPAALAATPQRIVAGTPEVLIGIAVCDRIDWDALDDLDPEEGDAKVVAQILYARDVPKERKVLLTQDTNPIAMAARHGLAVRKLSPHWLMEPEPSPDEKEKAKLKARVSELEANEPKLELSIEFPIPAPLKIYKVEPLNGHEQSELIDHILQEHPPRQGSSGFLAPDRDYSYGDRYEKYEKNTVPRHAEVVHKRLEMVYGQIPFSLEVKNAGSIQAENLVVEVRAVDGVLHDRFSSFAMYGPSAPEVRSPLHHLNMRQFNIPTAAKYGRHEVHFEAEPDRDATLVLNCQDFRHGSSWALDGVATIDPEGASPFKLVVTASASNMRGAVTEVFEYAFEAEAVRVETLVDLTGRTRHIEYPMVGMVTKLIDAKKYDQIHVVKPGYADEDDEDD